MNATRASHSASVRQEMASQLSGTLVGKTPLGTKPSDAAVSNGTVGAAVPGGIERGLREHVRRRFDLVISMTWPGGLAAIAEGGHQGEGAVHAAP